MMQREEIEATFMGANGKPKSKREMRKAFVSNNVLDKLKRASLSLEG